MPFVAHKPVRARVCVCVRSERAQVFNLIFEVLSESNKRTRRTKASAEQSTITYGFHSASSVARGKSGTPVNSRRHGTSNIPFVYMSITHFSFQVENSPNARAPNITCAMHFTVSAHCVTPPSLVEKNRFFLHQSKMHT